MRQIARVEIENFQSHAHSALEFSPGLNVIIGPSDNGKSAVLRAIRWALYNEPRGADFVRSGARECRVRVTMSDGTIVTRELTLSKSGNPSRNRYLVRTAEGQEQVFEGFGTEVPAEVVKAHGMPQVLLDTDKRVVLSFGTQLEGPFLLTETGSFRARAIGRLLGVHVVDAAGRHTQRDLLTVRKEIGRLEREAERYEHDLQAYTDIPAQEERLDRAEAALVRAEQIQARLERLVQVQQGLDRTERDSVAVEAALGRLGGVESAQQALRRAEEQHRHGLRVERVSQELTRVEQERRHYALRVDALAALPLAEERARVAADRQTRLTALGRLSEELQRRASEEALMSTSLTRLEQVERATALLAQASAAAQRLERLQQSLAPLRDVEQRLTSGREHLKEVEGKLQAGLADYEQVLRQLGRCPTCMQPVTAAAIPRILAELTGGSGTGHSH